MDLKYHKHKNIAISVILGMVLIAICLVGTARANVQTTVRSPQAVVDPNSNYVIVQKWDGANPTIWSYNGVSLTYITTGYSPRLSHNGRYLAYKEGGLNKWNADLYVLDLQSNTKKLMFDNDDHIGYYSWSIDDSHLYFDYSCKIYSVNRESTLLEVVIENWPASYSCWNDWPDVNPVDGRITWENENYGLGIANGDGSSPAWIPNTQKYDYDARWSHDGQWIVFYRADNAYKIKPDGSSLTQLTLLSGDSNNWADWVGGWTGNSSCLIGTMNVDGVYGIYGYPSDGSGKLNLLFREAGIDEYFIGDVGNFFCERVYVPFVLNTAP